jgi:hypothetical protein
MNFFFHRSRPLVAGAALFLITTQYLNAQTDADANRLQKLEEELKAMRQQIVQLQEQHAREIGELKALIRPSGAVAADDAQPTSSPVARLPLYESLKRSVIPTGSAAAGNTGIDLDLAVVLDGALYHTSGEGAPHLRGKTAGFGHGHDDEDGHHHDHGPHNGFNLRHVELGFSAEVDPYFRAWTTVAVDEDGAELEEAVIQTTSLPHGLTLSGGKLKSGIGRINRQHSHTWDFWDQPLVYELLFGAHGLAEQGAQLTWLAPTSFYLLFGAEAFNGANENLFHVLGEDPLPQHDAPRLWTGFVKYGPDLGDRHALQFGLSALSGRHQVWHEDEAEGANGRTFVYGCDFVYKYDAKRTRGAGDFTVQGEYYFRDQDLTGVGDIAGEPWTHQQDGYYLQALYGFRPRWSAGLRWDQVGLTNTSTTPEHGRERFDDSRRLAAMLVWNLSEFSLLRLQGGQGWYTLEDGRERAWELALQWQVAFGKHAAHDF